MEFSYQANQAQNQKQTQRLILSARMKESLEFLQMSLPDLQKKVATEILENPVLERDEQSDTPETDNKAHSVHDREIQWLSDEASRQSYDFKPASFYRNESFDSLATKSREPTFRGFLLKQLSELDVYPTTARICRYIIDCLDEKGYLHDSVDDIATSLGIQKTKAVSHALEVIKGMDPAGVGASDLRECLAIQAGRQPWFNPAANAIIDRYLGLLAENKVKDIAQRLDISVATAQECCNVIRKLNPIPSSGFNTETCEKFVLPEATVKFDECGDLCVVSSCDETEQLLINPLYYTMAQNTDDPNVKKYLKDKIKRASALIDDISNRKKTILRIIEMIVKLQPQYFKGGSPFLKPMSMKFLAEQLGLNESTVSRTIQDKFILCPLGMVPLKTFFTHSVQAGKGGSATSVVTIKEKIKKIIQLEDRARPLSDQEIAVELSRCNMTIARRTVAKYREELAIPPMMKRKIFERVG